jgi:excisionase family DNA binding protein
MKTSGVSRERLYTADEVGEYLRLHERTVRRLIASRKLRGFKVGKTWMVTDSDIARYLEEKRQEADQVKERVG